MNKRELQRIIQHIANENHTTPEAVRQEMQYAMEAGQNSSDPAVQDRWNSIPRKGSKLTLEEFIEYIVQATSSSLP